MTAADATALFDYFVNDRVPLPSSFQASSAPSPLPRIAYLSLIIRCTRHCFYARLCRVASSFTYEWLDSYFTLVFGSVAKHHLDDTRISSLVHSADVSVEPYQVYHRE